jgi:hypothetical protein
MSTGRRPPGFVPGYMTEDLQMREVCGPPRYTSRTNKPVEHITLATQQGELMGYLYINDEDDAAGWEPVAGASPDAQNLVAPWNRMLLDAKKRGLKPSAALEEMLRVTLRYSHVVPGSRQTSASLDALRALAGDPATKKENSR